MSQTYLRRAGTCPDIELRFSAAKKKKQAYPGYGLGSLARDLQLIETATAPQQSTRRFYAA